MYLDVFKAKRNEEETQMQSVAQRWYVQRSIRLTSSLFGRVMNQRFSTDPIKLVHEITKETAHTMRCSAIPSLKWEKENEAVAVSQYSSLKCRANQII